MLYFVGVLVFPLLPQIVFVFARVVVVVFLNRLVEQVQELVEALLQAERLEFVVVEIELSQRRDRYKYAVGFVFRPHLDQGLLHGIY